MDDFGRFFVNMLVAIVVIAAMWWLLVLLSHAMAVA